MLLSGQASSLALPAPSLPTSCQSSFSLPNGATLTNLCEGNRQGNKLETRCIPLPCCTLQVLKKSVRAVGQQQVSRTSYATAYSETKAAVVEVSHQGIFSSLKPH